ncbi:MAG: domain:Divalent cation transporter [Pseudomonadota bacterium]|jgi:magnesium transporter
MSDELFERPPARGVDEHLSDAAIRIASLVRQYRLLTGFAESLEDAIEHPSSQRPAIANTLNQLRHELEGLHPADIAHILEVSPLDERQFIWDLVKADRDGEILLEVSDAVRDTLIAGMDREELVAAAVSLDADEIADLAPDLPTDVLAEVSQGLDAAERSQLSAALSFEEDEVGSLMDFDQVSMMGTLTVDEVLKRLRTRASLPDHTDQIFVVDLGDRLQGVVPVNTLLVADDHLTLAQLMREPSTRFEATDKAEHAAAQFERYDLVSAPVVGASGMLLGRITVNQVLDFIREAGEEDLRLQAGLKEDEDIFASVWKSVQNRWAWLSLNLITAFVASQVTRVFAGSIEKLVILAVVQSIVAGIGGNSGNQTLTMIARGIATGQVDWLHLRRLMFKETKVALVNGLIFGGLIGLVFAFMEKNLALGAVITAAMMLNLLLASFMGVLIPLYQLKRGADPARGSSVLLTFFTDTGGFFIFLGLASLFLL